MLFLENKDNPFLSYDDSDAVKVLLGVSTFQRVTNTHTQILVPLYL